MATVPALDVHRYPSLLPYLQGGRGGARLKLSLLPADQALGETSYPFNIYDDTQPVVRSIEAAFLTDTGTVLKRVVLQIQKDRYTLPADELHPLTNPDIDACWQGSFSEGNLPGGELLAAQRDADGTLRPLAPLFFCRKRELFFHPVCPACGLPLTLCTDDNLLNRSGLAPYSSTRKRYLHCAPCCGDGLSEFYLHELDPADPITVKDRLALIDRFRQIEPAMDPEGEFPCVGCPEHGTCFGPTSQVRSRVIPFSFYPFYLLASELPSLHGTDFLHLVSGATPSELANRLDPRRCPGRVSRLSELAGLDGLGESLFGRGDRRLFLEVLFLKLSFLNSLLLRFAGKQELSDVRLRSDRVWVHLPKASPVLPASWNFRLELAPDLAPDSCSLPLVTPSESLGHLGLFWIEVLCQNVRVGQSDIYSAVSDWLRNGAGQVPGLPGGRLAEILEPENLLWKPESATVRVEWLPLWEKACEPAYQLLQAARSGGAGVSYAALLRTLDELRDAVKSAIFAAPPAAPPAAVLPEIEPPPAGSAPLLTASSDDADETMETVMLSPGPPRSASAPLLPRDQLCETCLVPASQSATPRALRPGPGDDPLETMVAGPTHLTVHSLQSSATESPRRSLLTSDGGPPSAVTVETRPTPPFVAEEDRLAETVFIQHPCDRRPRD